VEKLENGMKAIESTIPNGALLATGFYHYACLKDYDTASKYLEQAERVLPHGSRVLQGLAYVERRRGNWDKSEAYFQQAEKVDPRNVNLLSQHARSHVCLRPAKVGVRLGPSWNLFSRNNLKILFYGRSRSYKRCSW
jgi:tetratricopeptide (TPR) repeat protein